MVQQGEMGPVGIRLAGLHTGGKLPQILDHVAVAFGGAEGQGEEGHGLQLQGGHQRHRRRRPGLHLQPGLPVVSVQHLPRHRMGGRGLRQGGGHLRHHIPIVFVHQGRRHVAAGAALPGGAAAGEEYRLPGGVEPHLHPVFAPGVPVRHPGGKPVGKGLVRAADQVGYRPRSVEGHPPQVGLPTAEGGDFFQRKQGHAHRSFFVWYLFIIPEKADFTRGFRRLYENRVKFFGIHSVSS